MNRNPLYDTLVLESAVTLKKWHYRKYRCKADEDLLQEAITRALENYNAFGYPLLKKHVTIDLIYRYRVEMQKDKVYNYRNTIGLPSDYNMNYIACNECLFDLKAISKIINRLFPSQRRTLILTMKGYKVNEIARLTKRTANSVKSQLWLVKSFLIGIKCFDRN